MRFEKTRWFHCLFRAGLVAGWSRPLRAVAHLVMLVADVGLFMFFASRVRSFPAYAPAVLFFALRSLYSLGLAFFPWRDDGEGGLFLFICNHTKSETRKE